MRTWTTRAARSTCRRSRRCTPPTWARSSCRTAAVSVENTHNFAGGAVLPLEDLRALRAWADDRRRRRPPRRRADLERPRRHRRRRWRSTARVADVLAVCLSKGLGAPVGSLMVGSRGRDRRGAGAAQADGRRDAAGRHPGRGRAARPRPPRRAAGRRPRPRAAAGRGLRRSTRRPSTPTSSWSSGRDAAAFVGGRAPRRACWSPRSARRAVRLVTHLDVSRADAERARPWLLEAGSAGSPTSDTSLIAV